MPSNSLMRPAGRGSVESFHGRKTELGQSWLRTRLVPIFVAAAVFVAGTPAAAGESAPRSWAIVVGTNVEVLGRNALRYAHRDAKAMSRTLIELGNFAERDVRLLLDPRPKEVLAVFDAVLSKAASTPDAVVLFYYSGHADAQNLYPDGAPLPLGELKKRLQDRRVGLGVGIVDACRGGGWTGTKGLTPDAPFEVEVPDPARPEGTVFVASSSGDQSAHESETLLGSFFTHHLISALRGAADDDTDGVVDLSEAYRYARRRTVRDAAIYADGEQHPSFSVSLSGRQDVPLTWLSRGQSTLVLGPRRSAIQIVALASGVTAFELPPGDGSITLAIDAGQYVLRKKGPDGATFVREVNLKIGGRLEVKEDDLQAMASARIRTKAAEDDNRRALREAGEVSVLLQAEPGTKTTFFLQDVVARSNEGASRGYTRLCTAPCRATVPKGVNEFGLSIGLDPEVLPTRPIVVEPDMTLAGKFQDNSTYRNTALVFSGVGLAVGVGFIIAAIVGGPGEASDPDFSDRFDSSKRNVGIGVATAGVSITFGLLVGSLLQDRAEVTPQP